MQEFKGTKGKWEVCDHSWSDTSILCGDKTIATKSIFYEATEETQDELDDEVSNNFRLLCAAPELLEACIELIKFTSEHKDHISRESLIKLTEKAINKALGL